MLGIGSLMRSLFSKVLISSWLFLILLIVSAVVTFLISLVLKEDLHILLFMVYLVFALYFSFFISYSLAIGVTEELKLLQEKTKKINAGEFTRNGVLSSIIEINQLSESIDAMSARLKLQFIDLNFEKEKFNLVLQNLKEGVFAIDGEKRILFQNNTIPESLIPKNSQSRSIESVIENKKFLNFLIQTIEKDQDGNIGIESKKKYYNISLYNLKPDDGSSIYIGMILDKTQERERQIFREQFFQNASHELKTPITSIKGYAETLNTRFNYPEESNEKKFLAAILRNTDRMIRIVEDMLTISRLESTNVVFQPEKFKLFDLIENLKLTIEGFIKIKKQKLTVIVPENLVIEADLLLIEHALLNLVQNASVYSPENSEIQLKASLVDDFLHLAVVDQGIGLEESDVERIFERFFRVDATRSRKEGGTGLGLSIVKHITKLHKGEITVDSKLGKGSTFTMKLPIDRN